MNNDIRKFIGVLKKKIYSNEDFKIYSVDVDKKAFPNVVFNQYGDVTITGNLHELVPDMQYEITGIEQTSKYGVNYKVKNIRVHEDKEGTSTYTFLNGILTSQQADELYRKYPDIVDLVIKGEADRVVDLTNLRGIKAFTFEKIKSKIVENYLLFDLINEYGDVLSITVLKEIYDKYPSIEKIKELIREDPYHFFTQLSRVGFKKADAMLLNMQKDGKLDVDYDLETSKQRCMSAVLYLLEENESEGNTRMNLKELKHLTDNLVPKCCSHFVECLKSDTVYYNIDEMIVARIETYNIEKYLAERLFEGLKCKIRWDIDIEKYKKMEDGSLTDEQMKFLSNICKHNISLLSGVAGSGKSLTISAVINMLDDNHKSYQLMSPTGKAARVLSEYTGRRATTIHIGLEYKHPNIWTFNKDNKLPVDVVVIDEFSMVDIYLFKRLLDAIDFNKTKLLIVGDNAQLNSVGAGNCLHNLINSGVIPVVELTKIFRYSEGGLMKVATDVRNCQRYLESTDKPVTVFGTNQDYVFIQSDSENILTILNGLYKKLLDKYTVQDIMVLAAYNKGDYGTVIINKELQKLANKNYGSDNSIKIKNTIFYVGDVVLQTKNDYKVPLSDQENMDGIVCNGETGVIKRIMRDSIIVEFDGVNYLYERDKMNNLLLGYAMSIHKSQGSQSKIVIVLTPSAHTYMMNSNLLYVALTRMKEKCYHIGDLKTINRGIKKKINLMRDTFLEEMLTNQ